MERKAREKMGKDPGKHFPCFFCDLSKMLAEGCFLMFSIYCQNNIEYLKRLRACFAYAHLSLMDRLI